MIFYFCLNIWDPQMPLIIDTYEVPALFISRKIFKSDEIEEIKKTPSDILEISKDKIYFIHGEDDLSARHVKYYFNEVVEVGMNMIYYNKAKKQVKYYKIDRDNDGFATDIVEIMEENIIKDSVDKTNFLPYLRAQDDEIVLFPENEDDDE